MLHPNIHFRRQNRVVHILLGHRDSTAMELWSLWVIRVDFRLSLKRYDPFDCGETRCVHHTVGRLKFAALAIHATELRLRRNIPTSVTLLTDLRRRCANTELCHNFQEGKQAGRIDPFDCSLGSRIPLRTCWSISRLLGGFPHLMFRVDVLARWLHKSLQ